MAAFVLLLGTIGAWLLVAGAIYQAALELREHDLAVARIRRTVASVVSSAPVSWWWWWFPPVKMALEWRRSIKHRKEHFEALSVEDCTSLVAYIHKATGWTLVGMGGLLMAIAQSYTFAQQHRVGDVAFVAIVAVLTIAIVVGCTLRFRLGDQFLEQKKRASGGQGPLIG